MPSTPPLLPPRPGALHHTLYRTPDHHLPHSPSRDNPTMPVSPSTTPSTIRPGGLSSPQPTFPCAIPPHSADISCAATSKSVFGRFNPFSPRLQRPGVLAYGEPVFPPKQELPSPCNQARFFSPGLPKPANDRLRKRAGGLRIVSVSSF